MNMNNSSFREHDARVRSTALRAFRVRKIQRRCAMVLPLITAIALVLVGRTGTPPVPTGASPAETLALKRTLPVTSHTEIARRGAGRDRRGRLSYPKEGSGGAGIKIEMITDEQLIAAFPPGSCYIAEVNGQKQLFFRDPKVKEQFFN
jgi:hypothetical protein